MRLLPKILTPTAWLLFLMIVAASSANAQMRYPSIEEAWDGTDYRALIQRVETDGLALPTLADAATKPVFERMVRSDNIPLRAGLDPKLAVTIRFQKLDSALPALHRLVALYASETEKGKPYTTELATLMIYEVKVSGALLDLHESYVSALPRDKRYQANINILEQMKSDARQLYSRLVGSAIATGTYFKPDLLAMTRGALERLPSYLPVFTSEDRQGLVQKLTQQIATTTDQEVKAALTELRDGIKHRRIPA